MVEKSNGRSLKSLTILYAIGNFGSKGLSFILIFFMTYFLSREEIGQYDLIITTVALIAPCAILSLDYSLFRWLIDLPKGNDNSGIFRNIFGVVLLNTMVYSLIYWLAISSTNVNKELHIYIFIYSILSMWLPLLQQGTRGLGKNELYICTSLIYSLLFVFLSVFCLYTGLGVKGILFANTFGLAVAILWLLWKNRLLGYLLGPKMEWQYLKRFLAYSLPLLPNTLSWWLISSATRYVILIYLGQESNGIFSVSYKYPMIVLIFSDVFSLAWQEKLIKIKNNEEAEGYFEIILAKYLCLIFGLVIVLCSTCKLFMHAVDPNFFESWKYIPLLLLAVLLQALSTFYSVPYLREKRSSAIFYTSLAGGVSTIISSLFLVKFGLFGISSAILLGFVVMLIYRILDVNTFFVAKFPVSKFIQLLGIYCVIAYGIYSDSTVFQWVGVIIAVITFVLYNKFFLRGFIDNLKTKFKKGSVI